MIATLRLRIPRIPSPSRGAGSWFIAAALALVPVAAAAAPEVDCYADAFLPESELTLATVRSGAPRVYFLRNGDADARCPADEASCREHAYLVPGDRVIVAQRSGALACAFYVHPQGGGRAGWLPRTALAATAEGPLRWAGRWTAGPEQSITVKADPAAGGLKMEGYASYGGQNPERVKRGSVNVGSFSAEFPTSASARRLLRFTAAENGTLPYAQGDEIDCRLRMRRIGTSLIVRDNAHCGGFNVSFSGIYRRAK